MQPKLGFYIWQHFWSEKMCFKLSYPRDRRLNSFMLYLLIRQNPYCNFPVNITWNIYVQLASLCSSFYQYLNKYCWSTSVCRRLDLHLAFILWRLSSCCPEFLKSRIKITPTTFLDLKLLSTAHCCICSGFYEKTAVHLVLYILEQKSGT